MDRKHEAVLIAVEVSKQAIIQLRRRGICPPLPLFSMCNAIVIVTLVGAESDVIKLRIMDESSDHNINTNYV